MQQRWKKKGIKGRRTWDYNKKGGKTYKRQLWGSRWSRQSPQIGVSRLSSYNCERMQMIRIWKYWIKMWVGWVINRATYVDNDCQPQQKRIKRNVWTEKI